jgi:hypothetical protein
MKKTIAPKQSKPKRARLSKIARIAREKTIDEKWCLAYWGMESKDFRSPEMRLSRSFFELRHVDDLELLQRIRREASSGRGTTVRTQTEWAWIKFLEKALGQYSWLAMRKWKPEAFEKLARAMRRIQKHNYPPPSDAHRRCALISCNGNVEDAFLAIKDQETKSDPLNVKRALYRLKKGLFPKDT